MKLSEWIMFLDALPNPVTLNRKSIDQDGTVYDTILHTNVAFQNTIGYTSEDIPTDRIWFEKAYPERTYQSFIITEWNKELKNAQKADRNLFGFPAKIRCKNDEYRWFNVSAHIDYAIENEFKIITFVEINSPEQNRFEKDKAVMELKHEKDFLHTLINMLPIRIFWKDKELKYLGCNKVFAQDAGFSDPEQMIGKNDYDMTWRDQAQLYRSDDLRVMKMGESTLGYIEPQTTPDGKQIWLRTSKIPLIDEKTGDVFGILGMYDDVTSQFLDQERLRYALTGTNDGLWDWNIDTNEIYFSPRWMEILGFEYGDYPQTLDTFMDLLDPKDKDRILDLFEAYSKGCTDDFEAEFRMKHKNGSWINILSRAKLTSDIQGHVLEPRRLVGTHSDISSRKNMESASHKRELYHRALLDYFPFYAWLKDARGHFLTASKPLVTMLGFQNPDQILGKTDYDLWSKELADSYLADDHEVMRNRKPVLREEEVLKGDTHKWVETYKAPILDEEGNVFGTVGFSRDITERKMMEKQLHRMAHYDSLTHLPNRLLFSDRLNQSMVHSKRNNTNLAIVYIDLDGFKNVNDKYGHNTGDELLIAIANQMKRALREGDTLARIGGDEFVVIFQDLDDIAEIKPVLERLLLSVSSLVVLDNIKVSLSASMGVTFYPQKEEIDADQLIRQADQAMYRAKQTGKNRYHFFDADQDRFVRIQHETIERIRKALNQDEL